MQGPWAPAGLAVCDPWKALLTAGDIDRGDNRSIIGIGSGWSPAPWPGQRYRRLLEDHDELVFGVHT